MTHIEELEYVITRMEQKLSLIKDEMKLNLDKVSVNNKNNMATDSWLREEIDEQDIKLSNGQRLLNRLKEIYRTEFDLLITKLLNSRHNEQARTRKD